MGDLLDLFGKLSVEVLDVYSMGDLLDLFGNSCVEVLDAFSVDDFIINSPRHPGERGAKPTSNIST